jgi:tape measure domain-containing protein
MAKLGSLVVNIGANTKDLNKKLGSVRRDMRQMGSNFKAIGSNMTRSLSLPLVAIGAMAIKSAADLQALETSFISLTGGTQQAAAMMKQLNDFTAKTPFQIDAVATSARQLIASGTKLSDVNEQLQFLGDIAATSGKPINELASIFAKVNAKGKVELESLNQLAERGIPIFQGLAKATGKLPSELGAGGVTVQQFNDYLRSLSEEGGIANGAMERLSETAHGKFSTAMDNLKIAGASLAQDLLPVINDLLDYVTDLAKSFTNLSPSTKKWVLILGGLTAVIGPLLVIVPQLVSGVVMLRGAFLALNATMLLNPYVLAGAAILALGLIIHQTGGDVHDTKRKTDEYILSLKQLDKQSQINSINEALRTKATQLNAAKDKLAASEMMLKHGDKFDKAAQLRQINMYNEIIAGVEGAIDALDVAMVEAQSMEVLKVDDLIVPPDPAKANHIANSIDAIRAKIADLTKTYNAAAVGSAEYTTAKQQLIAANEELEAALGNTTGAVTLAEGSIDALRARVSELQAAYNAAAPGSEALATASKELTIATNDLDAALGNTAKTLGFFSEFPVGSLGFLQDKLAFLRAELLLLNPETQAFVDKLSEIEAMSVIVNGSIETIDESIKNTTSAFKDLGQSITDAFVDAVFEAKSFGDAMLQIGKQLIKTLLGEAIASAIASAASSKNIANQASGGLTIPGFILGAVASVKGAFNQVPALAAGGLAFGETMSIVGDNRNAALDPEVIAPLSKLKDYIGGGQTNVYGRISGDDIVISNSRGARDRNRFV